MRQVSIFLICMALAGAAEAQPLSQSMAQCAGLMNALGALTSDPERVEKIDRVAVKWRAAAILQAQDEGRGQPAEFVGLHQSSSYDDWRGRGKLAVLSQDFRDWVAYCGSLAKARGLDVKPD